MTYFHVIKTYFLPDNTSNVNTLLYDLFYKHFFQKALRVLVTIWLEDISQRERSSYGMQFTGLNKHHVIRYLMLNQWTVIETMSFPLRNRNAISKREVDFPVLKESPILPQIIS